MRRLEDDSALQSAVLEDLAEAVNYRRWLVELGLPYLDGPTLEVGSGRGDYAADWADRGVAMTASEADPSSASGVVSVAQGTRTSFPRRWPAWLMRYGSAARSKGKVCTLITSLFCASSSATSRRA